MFAENVRSDPESIKRRLAEVEQRRWWSLLDDALLTTGDSRPGPF